LRQERERRRIRREINARRRGSCATNGNGMSREEWLFLGVILILAVAGYLFPTFGMLSLVLGLAALFVALPIRWASGGSSGNLLMLFAMGALGLLYHRFGLLPVIVRRVVFNAVLLSFPLFLSTTSGNR